MSTLSLPNYTRHDPQITGYPLNPPSYYDNQPSVSTSTALGTLNAPFVKASKTGTLTLELYDQPVGASLPTFGRGALILGKVTLQKPDTVLRVNAKIEGCLRMEEFGEVGKASDTILSQDILLWSHDSQNYIPSCPSTLEIVTLLPETYEKDNNQFPLPPTFEFQTTGMPGFRTEVVYSITVTMTKKKTSLFGNQTIVTTAFVYLPRTRSPTPPFNFPSIPASFLTSAPDYSTTLGWEIIESNMKPRANSTAPIVTKLYLPKGRIFPTISTIPFRLHISSPASSSFSSINLCSPDHSTASPTSQSFDPKKGTTRVYISRQISVSIRQSNIFKAIDVGEATFEKLGDGPNWTAWEGVITPDRSILTCGSFKAGGLWVKDCIVLSIIPPSPQTSPFFELRSQTLIRLVTDPNNGTAADRAG